MGLFDKLFGNDSTSSSTSDIFDGGTKMSAGAIDYGKQKKDGGHDHRYDKGTDRTPSQKKGDNKKAGKDKE